MKKGLLLTVLAISTLLVSGCGETEKHLKCSLTEEASGTTTTSVMEMDFKGNQAQNISLNISINYPEEFASYADVFKQTLETQKSNLEEIGYEVQITSGDNSQNLTATGTVDTLDSSETTGSYEATKESFEESGYVCE